MIGIPKSNKLVSIKKLTNFKAQREISTKLKFMVKAAEGERAKAVEYKVYLICDSYIGCDQEDNLTLKLAWWRGTRFHNSI